MKKAISSTNRTLVLLTTFIVLVFNAIQGYSQLTVTGTQGVCEHETDILRLTIEECCNIDFNIMELRCVNSSPQGNTYSFVLMVDGVPCPTYYNLSASNGYSTQLFPNAIIVDTVSPQMLIPGQNQLNGEFTTQPNDSMIQFFISLLCEPCNGETGIETLPGCSKKRMSKDKVIMIDSSGNGLCFLSLFPNPADETVTISYRFAEDKFNEPAKRNIRIFDLTGHPLLTINVQNIYGEYKLNTQELSGGIYLIALMQNGSNIKTKRLIINH